MDRDKSIIAQNSGGHAAVLVAALINSGSIDTSVDVISDIFDVVRQRIFEGALELAGVETVIETFEGSTSNVREAVAQSVESAPAATGVVRPNANLEVKFGKHRGLTIAAIDAKDPSWLKWAAENANNDFMRKSILAYLAA